MKNEILKDEELQENDKTLSENELSKVSGGISEVIEIKAKEYKVNCIEATTYPESPDVWADESTGFKVGDVLYIEWLNKEYTVRRVTNISFGIEVLIIKRGEYKDVKAMSRIRKVN